MYFDINLEISEFKKENISLIMYRNIFQNILQKYLNFKHLHRCIQNRPKCVNIDDNWKLHIFLQASSQTLYLHNRSFRYIKSSTKQDVINKESLHHKYLILSYSPSSLTGINNLINPIDVSKNFWSKLKRKRDILSMNFWLLWNRRQKISK